MPIQKMLFQKRRILRYLDRAGPRFEKAFRRVPKPVRRLFLSGYQSYLFNRVLAERLKLEALDVLWKGDVAMKHENGACFRVEDPAAEEERLRRFEISPTGPVFGRKMLRSEGREGELERGFLASEGVDYEDFRKIFPGLELRGARRAFRVRPEELRWELEGKDVVLSFSLPKGSYATVFLREIVKPELLGETEALGSEE